MAPEIGVLRASTEGSDFDTVLAVYTGPGTDFATLKLEASDNNSGADGKDSVATLKVTKGTTYFVAVDGVKGASGTVKLSYDLGAAPVVSTPPASQKVKVGDSVGFVVDVANPLSGATTSIPPVSYQWLKDGVKIAGETSRSLALLNVQNANGGDYTVIVSNFAGSATSQVARLSVNVPLSITAAPQSQTGRIGHRIEFRLVVSGPQPITYQWRFNGSDIAGATSGTYAIASARRTDAGTFAVVARNEVGSVQSADVALTINEAPAITTAPADQTVLLGGQ